mmetsp:Transcript_21048/g.44890  ORF Transcript_21048/g.44890 Transcript_21048/m.44890 type:complete len:207 (-) Transcript_21048:118-738(-)
MVNSVPADVLLAAPSARKMKAERPKSASRVPAKPVMDTSLPFGRLTGLETAIATKVQKAETSGGTKPLGATSTGGSGDAEKTRMPRPKSAGAGSRGDWNIRWSTVSRTFEERGTAAPAEKQALFFGPKHKSYREKIQRLLDDDFLERKKESVRVKDGTLRRQEIEEAIVNAGKEMRPCGSRGRLFSDQPLLSTSEAAVEWYLQKSR